MKIKRTLPPAGAPLYMGDLVSGIRGIIRPSKALTEFQESLKSYFGVKYVFLVSSGKAALTLILKSLSEMTGRDEVVIPSYTCFSVPSAIVKAELKPVICDIMENDFNYDVQHLNALVGKRTLCVVATHLFGIPCDIESVLSVARSAGSFVVEDCAQAMGAELDGRKVGTIGDVGFFSLGRGKNLCAVSGGIIITNDDKIGGVVSKKVSELKPPGIMRQMFSLFVAIFLYVFSRPSLYWFPASLPFLKIGQTIFSTDFPIEKLAGFNAGLAAIWESKLETFNKARRGRADFYKSKLNCNGFVLVQEPTRSFPVYLRFPIITNTPSERDRICRELSSAGLGASPNYPTGIAEILQLGIAEEQKSRCHLGNTMAKQILTLPTHPQVDEVEVKSITELIHGRNRSLDTL